MKKLVCLFGIFLLLGCVACSSSPADQTEVRPEKSPDFNSLIRQESQFDVYNGSMLRMNLYLQQTDGCEVYYQKNADGTEIYEENVEVIGPTGQMTYRQLLAVIDAVAKYAQEQDFGLNETSIVGRKLPMYSKLFFETDKLSAVQQTGSSPYFICSIGKKSVVSVSGSYQGTAVALLEATNSATPNPVYIVIEQ